MTPRIGSLFSGVAGLDLAVEAFFGADVAWFVEWEKAPSKVLAHHYPGVPNYGDVTKTDWSKVEPVDILTGGFPCQDVSLAGARAGMSDGTRSGLWSEYAKAIDVLRPSLVVIENVRGLLSAKTIEEVADDVEDQADRAGEYGSSGVGESAGGDRPVLNAFGRVLLDLAAIGYDAEWVGLRASDAGAPHGRFRVFIIAYPSSKPGSVVVGDSAAADDSEGIGRDDGHAVDVGSSGGTVDVPGDSGDAAGGSPGTSKAADPSSNGRNKGRRKSDGDDGSSGGKRTGKPRGVRGVDVLFIGGSTDWKMGAAAQSLIAEAKARGKWVHMGRVNSQKRMRYAANSGCDSADGTFITFGPDQNLPKVLGWLRDVEHAQLWDDEVRKTS